MYRLAGAPETERSIVSATVCPRVTGPSRRATTTLALRGIRRLHAPARRWSSSPDDHTASRCPASTETFLLPDRTCTVVDGIPTATVARALFDLAGTFGDRRLARAVDAALAGTRGDGRRRSRRVVDDLAERGRRGSPSVACASSMSVRDGLRAADDGLESRVPRARARRGLPEPERQVADDGSLGWIGTVDFVWPDRRVVVETDGATFHDSVTDRENDERETARSKPRGGSCSGSTGTT